MAGESTTNSHTRNRLRQPNGRLMRNTQCQEYASVRPMAGAITTVSPYNAKEAGRSRNGNESAKIDCSTGASPPPPRPWTTRHSRISGSELAVAQSSELMVNSATQIM